MNQSITEGRIQVIEELLRKYPDTPPEIIIKHDLITLGQGFSDSALAAAAGAMKKTYGLFSIDLVPMSAMQREEYLKVPQYFVIKGGPYNLRPVNVRSSIAADSPYLIDVVDGRIKLLLNGVDIADVGYSPPMKYYSKTFPDGVAYSDVIGYGSSIIAFRLCQFWGVKEECKFCDINENTRQVQKSRSYTQTAPVKKVEQVAEVADEIGREVFEREGYPAPIHFAINGGTITSKLHGLSEEDFYLQYVEAVKWGGPRRDITLVAGAADKETCKRFHQTGVDSHYASLEVWDKHLFKWICPGKSGRVGWEEWVKRVVDSVDIYGEGNVRPQLVGGVEMAQPYGFKTVAEAVRSTTEGMKFFMSRGAMPRFNPWRREPGAYLQKKYNQQPVPPEYCIHLMRNFYENWKRYGLPLPHRTYASPDMRMLGRGEGIHDDYLLIMEQKDYESRALQALKKAGTVWSFSPDAIS